MGLIPRQQRIEDTPHAAREWVGHYTPSQFQTTSPLPSFKMLKLSILLVIHYLKYSSVALEGL